MLTVLQCQLIALGSSMITGIGCFIIGYNLCKLNKYPNYKNKKEPKRVYCKQCNHILFEIDLYNLSILSNGNKPHLRFYGLPKPLLKHIEVTTTCDICGNKHIDVF